VTARRTVVPLVPRYRVTGLPFGGSPSRRRGHGSEVAGSRAYVRGDPVSTIDWRASARLSTARSRDEFVVRERYAEEAPRVVVFCDLGPSMRLYASPLPWLSKPDASREAVRLIARSAAATNAAVAYADLEGANGDPYWIPPRGRAVLEQIEARLNEVGASSTSPRPLSRGLEFLGRFRSELSSGTFIFVISDFLEADLDHPGWLTAAARRWEIIPVVVQDPVWEQSFPELGSLVVPMVDPATGASLEARISRRQARRLRDANRERRERLLAQIAALGLDPVLIGSSDPVEIERDFLSWAARRHDLRQRR
jgi:uncharacterized protein (DUF58 family)